MDSTSTIEPPRMAITLPRLSIQELAALTEVCVSRGQPFPAYASLVVLLLQEEAERRDNPGSEPGMIQLPKFDIKELSELLMASYVFARWPLTETMHAFLDELGKHIICDCIAVLDLIGDDFTIKADGIHYTKGNQ